jgi:putative glutamine amidotransferase
VHDAGGAAILLPLVGDRFSLLEVLARLDGLLLAGGGDIRPHHFGQTAQVKLRSVDPPRDEAELFLVRQALDGDLPILAICRGMQLLNVALGGTLCQDIGEQMPEAMKHDFYAEYPRWKHAHAVSVYPGSRLAGIVDAPRLLVNSFHHQCVKDIARGLLVTAAAPDGVVEAVELPERDFVIGVQWHPEELIDRDPRMKRLMEAFVAAARDYARVPRVR